MNAQQPSEAVRTWQWIAFSCLSTLLPASYTIMRPGLIPSNTKRMLLSTALFLKGLLLPHWVLFEATADFIIAWLIAKYVNAAALRCYTARTQIVTASTGAAEQMIHIRNRTAHTTRLGPAITLLSFLTEWVKRIYKILFKKEPQFYDLVGSARIIHKAELTF